MATATITSKGQVTIPVDVRKRLGLKPGDRIDFIVDAGGEVRLRAKKVPIEKLLGAFHKPGRKRVSAAQIKEAVLDQATEDWERIRSQED